MAPNFIENMVIPIIKHNKKTSLYVFLLLFIYFSVSVCLVMSYVILRVLDNDKFYKRCFR